MKHTVHVEGGWGRSTVECAPGELLLDALIRQDVPVAFCCRAGLCGMCKMAVADGAVERLPASARALTADEAARGEVLACCAMVLSDCSLRPLTALQPGRAAARVGMASVAAASGDLGRIVRLAWDGAAIAAAPGQWAWFTRVGADGGPVLACCADGSVEFTLTAGAFAPSTGQRVLVEGPVGTAVEPGVFEHPVAIVLDGCGGPVLPALAHLASARPKAVALLVQVGAPAASRWPVAARQLDLAPTEEGFAALRAELAALAAAVAAEGRRLRVVLRGAADFQARVRKVLAGSGVRVYDVLAENLLDLGRDKDGKQRDMA